ncbi:hypothetical protein NBO_19g0025 [Nosema bombycis CQ1]|uniref:Uncharacterized protein n=1 Tax=Nosema bombycis (strain CQ1 / CVCC 102059) TaxID=578461 RepID=R0KWR4_NOSB1|nr:hypothetical protein NBO_19g0025 [Nosema bombycis CQ1]|eukprot:EOB14672.1 hypothetical protein NBO_19g0025 [Nosema bombycis CQ1]
MDNNQTGANYQTVSNFQTGLKAILDNQIVFLDVHSARLYINFQENNKEKIINLKNIKTLHTKNEDRFFLKLKLVDEDLVFTFENHNSRDLMKNILLKYIKPENELVEKVLEKDSNVSKMFNRPKNIVSSDTFWGINRDKILESYNIMLQQPSREINFNAEEFIYSLPPVFLKIFGELNCSINQFYNHLRQSHFFDIRNKPTFIDRMLIDNLRDFKIESNYATRINNQSLVNMNSFTKIKNQNVIEPKITEFEPIYYLEEVNEERIKTGFVKGYKPLICDLNLKIEEKIEDVKFDKKDLKKAVDLSKLVFKCKKKKIDLSKDLGSIKMFTEELKKKYGEKNMKYLKRILPTYFI